MDAKLHWRNFSYFAYLTKLFRALDDFVEEATSKERADFSLHFNLCMSKKILSDCSDAFLPEIRE